MVWKEYSRNIKVRLITTFFNRSVSSAVLPFMALFFAQEINRIFAGLILMGSVIIGFLSNLLGGYLCDRFQRKRLLLITSILNSIMFLLMTISLRFEDKNIQLFTIAFIIYTFTSYLGRPALRAIIIDSTNNENRNDVYILEYWIVNLSIAVGTTIGSLLYTNYQFELFIFLTVVSAALSIAYYLGLIEVNRPKLIKKFDNIFIDLYNNYKIAFQNKAFVKVVTGTMCVLSAEFTLNNYIGVRLANEFHSFFIGTFKFDGIRMLGALNVENTLLVVCLTFLITKWIKRFSQKRMILVGLLFYSIGYTVVTSANTWYMLILFYFIASVGELIYSPILNTEQANMMPSNQRGSYSALINLSSNGAELMSRFTIFISAFLIPSMMSVYIGLILLIGCTLVYIGLYSRNSTVAKGISREIS